MNSYGLHILDQNLQWSLLVLVGVFLLLTLYQIAQLRARQLRASNRYRGDSIDADPLQLSFGSQLRLGYRSLLIAAAAGLVTFAATTFAPIPGIDNFVTGNAWRETPLRVTEVKPDRTTAGFSLTGQVWNQSDEALEGIELVLRIWGTDDKLLDEVTTPTNPTALAPGAAARFKLSYDDNAPFIGGYQLAFRDPEDNPIPHVTGFDVR